MYDKMSYPCVKLSLIVQWHNHCMNLCEQRKELKQTKTKKQKQ